MLKEIYDEIIKAKADKLSKKTKKCKHKPRSLFFMPNKIGVVKFGNKLYNCMDCNLIENANE